MSMTTGRSHRSCLYSFNDLHVIEKHHVNYFTLLLNALAIEVEVVVGVTTYEDTMMEIMVSCR